MSDTNPRASIKLPSDFVFGEVRADHKLPHTVTPAPPLGPLAAFKGDWVGNGFNTIFRPDNTATPTALPNPIPPPPPPLDNILELNLTSESLSFSPSLGSVPNRGTTPQGDIFLNGVPYLQTIKDITIHGESVGIHAEPGIWIHVPATTVPPLGESITRMASIPHGTTIEAQGTSGSVAGPPTINPVDITPFQTGNPANKIKFASQTAIQPKHAENPAGSKLVYRRRDHYATTLRRSELVAAQSHQQTKDHQHHRDHHLDGAAATAASAAVRGRSGQHRVLAGASGGHGAERASFADAGDFLD